MRSHRSARRAAIALLFALPLAARAATLTVDTTSDNNSTDDDLSLREAMLLANGTMNRCLRAGEKNNISGASFATIVLPVPGFCEFTPGPGVERYSVTGGLGGGSSDTIQFNGGIGGQIDLLSELPELRNGDTLNGDKGSGVRMILEGTFTTNAHGIVNQGFGVSSQGVKVLNLEIRNFDYNGVLSNTPGSGVYKNLSIHGNGLCGIALFGQDSGNWSVDFNQIGGPSASDRNFIFGNGQHGILIQAAPDETSAPYGTGNLIQNNWVGVDTLGTLGTGRLNGQNGIILVDIANSTVTGNVASGNSNDGIQLTGQYSTGNTVSSNNCGLFPNGSSGSSTTGNDYSGVALLNNANSNTITGNWASSNGGAGIYITTDNNTVRGNYVGLNAAGTAAYGNAGAGIALYGGASGNAIGGNGQGNVIAGNAQGIDIANSGTSSNTIFGNYIGLNAAGAAALANGIGIRIFGGATSNVIGGSGSDRNLISGNTSQGIGIYDSGTINNVIAHNHIGLNASGAAAANGANGVEINSPAGSTTVNNNVISGNAGSGVRITGSSSSGSLIRANYIGTNTAGTGAVANGADGVRIENGAKSNTVGGSDSYRNVISGNTGNGVQLAGSGTTGNTASYNYIGLNAAGNAKVANATNGVLISSPASSNNVTNNKISGNSQDGVRITGASAALNQVKTNYIGLDATGAAGLGNTGDGVQIDGGADTNTIGAASAGNFIGGNGANGVYLTGSGTESNTVYNNVIGLNTAGTVAIANVNGVKIDGGAQSNTIGGPAVFFPANFICGNSGRGVLISGTGTAGNAIIGNFIGLMLGNADFGNGQGGVRVEAGATNNFIGDDAPNNNWISGNDGPGIELDGSATSANQIQGNYIGTNIDGDGAVSNARGIRIWLGAHDNVIGGPNAGDRNIISGNTLYGIALFHAGTDSNIIRNNYIGLNAAGTGDLGNATIGVLIQETASENIVRDNKISGNNTDGVQINNSGTTGNQVFGNFIGTNAAGTAAVGNSGNGVLVQSGASGNTIGASGGSNLISGNGNDGVQFNGQGTMNNIVQYSVIGLNPGTTAAIGNAASGVSILGGALENHVGVSGGGGNVIGGNNYGVFISDSLTEANHVVGNTIGTNGVGAAGLGNSVAGVGIYGGAGNMIGGDPQSGDANTISGNEESGIDIATSSDNVIAGNRIGTNPLGTAGLPNGIGVRIRAGSLYNRIGKEGSAGRNIISGNYGPGVAIEDAMSEANTLENNFIGLNGAGVGALANSVGILINGPGNNIGTGSGGGLNYISGNVIAGVFIEGPSADGNELKGNVIGLNVSGAAAPNGVRGVYVANAPNTLIGDGSAGLVNLISGNGDYGIQIFGAGATNTRIKRNGIGVGTGGGVGWGISAAPNGSSGIYVNGAPNTVIGGADSGSSSPESNIISGNSLDGIYAIDATGLRIEGNIVGLSIDRTAKIPNGRNGITITGACVAPQIGSTLSSRGNWISGNTAAGLRLDGTTDGALVLFNRIGAGSVPYSGAFGNTGAGISIGTATDSILGDPTGFAINEIAYNGGDGVSATAGSGNYIVGSLIHDNGGLGIDLGADGVQVNDALDADAGANGLQNYPVLATAAGNGSSMTIQGALSSAANTQYDILFFSNDSCDGSGNGEGATVLGGTTVTTNGAGNAFINVVIPSFVPAGKSITALATDPNDNTSEFSPCVLSTIVGPTPTPSPSLTASLTPSPSVTPSVSPTTTPSPSASPSLSPTASTTPSVSPTPTATPTISPTPTATLSPSISLTDSPTPTATPTPPPPVFAVHPESQTVNTGELVVFQAAATGAGPITYQWVKDGAPLSGQTGETLTLNGAGIADAGDYRCDATNIGGTTPSNVATLTVLSAKPPNSADYLGTSLRAQMYRGQSLYVGFTFANTSAVSWSVAQGYSLGQTEDNDLMLGGATRLPIADGTVVDAGGGIYVFVGYVTAPNSNGPHQFKLQMVEEGVEFFGPAVTFTVQVTDPPNAAVDWESYE